MLATNKLDKEFLDKLSLIIEEEISDFMAQDKLKTFKGVFNYDFVNEK